MNMLPDQAFLQFTPDMQICRLINGLWQVSGAHGSINPQAAAADMLDYHRSGMTTWDLADHYGPAEDFIGAFSRQIDPGSQFFAFTKWVPRPMPISRSVAEKAVDLSRRRMAAERLDLLQFHWWDYGDPAYLDALRHLADLRDQGWIRHLALTNFDTRRLEQIAAKGIRIVSNQVQYSIIDRRPEVKMIDYCRAQAIWLLPYGTLCGGLLTDYYLGAQEPGISALRTASLRKYKQMIDAWGGWALFQELLKTLRQIADRHGVTIANVATRYILDKPQVAGVIIGARLGVQHHRDENAQLFSFLLDDEDRAMIDAFSQRSRDLFRLIGDCGDEYRR
jgi:aryl-alcohol dehydrogenase-like predicted oxidoreductase